MNLHLYSVFFLPCTVVGISQLYGHKAVRGAGYDQFSVLHHHFKGEETVSLDHCLKVNVCLQILSSLFCLHQRASLRMTLLGNEIHVELNNGNGECEFAQLLLFPEVVVVRSLILSSQLLLLCLIIPQTQQVLHEAIERAIKISIAYLWSIYLLYCIHFEMCHYERS